MAIALLLVAAILIGCVTTPAISDGDEPIPFDSQTRRGTLDNGLSYYIRANGTPPERAHISLVVNAGSILERPDQRGLAHFVEHMAFNGTNDFPGNRIVTMLESLGISFGAHTNAYTSFDETVYFLRLPTDDLRIGIHILEQWAHALEFDGQEIEKERGVVLEEWRLSLGADSRIRNKQLPVLLRDSRYADRLPIGDPDIITSFDHQVLKDYYRSWYRPDLMAIIAVGDFDPDEVEALIREYFGPLAAPDNLSPRPIYDVPIQEDTRFSIVADPETPETRLFFLQQIKRGGLRTIDDYRARTIERLYGIMFNRRLDRMLTDAQSPFLDVGAGISSFARRERFATLFAQIEENNIAQALRALIIETRRIEEHGFGDGEFKRAKDTLLRSVEVAYEQRNTRNSRSYVQEYTRHYLADEASPGIEYELNLTKQLVDDIGIEDINAVAHQFMSSDRTVWLSGPQNDRFMPPDEARLSTIIDEANNVPVVAYVDTFNERSLITESPTPGSITSETTHPDLGTTTWLLSNGARVIIKPTDFKDDEVLFATYSWGGLSLVSDDVWDAAREATGIVAEIGLADISSNELEELLADANVSLDPYIDFYSEGMRGSASVRDLETLLQLIHLSFVEPHRTEDGFQTYIRRLENEVRNRDLSPFARFRDRYSELYFGDHPRTRPHTLETVAQITLDDALDVYRDRYADADDFAFLFVGAIEPAQLRPLVETYIASLPAHPPSEQPRNIGINYTTGVVRETIRAGQEQQSVALISLHGGYEWSRTNNYYMQSLVDLLNILLREEIREEQGGVYSISASVDYSRLPLERYAIRISFGADPKRVDTLIDEVLAIVTNLPDAEIDSDYITRIRNTQLNEYESGLSENGFWLAALQHHDLHDLDPSLIWEYRTLAENLTADDIRAIARRFLDPQRYLQLVLLPETEEE